MSLFFKRSSAAPRTILNNPPSAEATRISSVSFTVEALGIGSQPKVENIGRLAWDDYPAEGDADDVADWTIYKISTDSAGDVTGEQSATGAWSNRLSLF